jgi:hypothetical protein
MQQKHKILSLIREFLIEKDFLEHSYSNLREIEKFFIYLNSSKEKFNSAYLLNYLYRNISSNEVAKRKTTARDFEDYLAILFNGKITDEIKRENSNEDNIFLENEYITNFILSNRREKSDIKFQGLDLSVKTLMKDNKELNLDSFEKTALFYLLNVEDFLNERKGKISNVNGENLKIGLGSKPLLKNLFTLLESENNLEQFKTRFLEMTKYIFADDIIIAIKNDDKMELYFLTSSDFIEVFKENIDDILKILNRWEGNSIRVNRDKILQKASKVELDFSFLETSFLKYFEEFENRISELLVLYINGSKEARQKIFEEIENLLNKIDLQEDLS